MGLYDFVADIGNKLFGDDEKEGAEKIKEYIEANNPGVEDLEVGLEDEVATLKGNAKDQAAAEKRTRPWRRRGAEGTGTWQVTG